MNKHDQRRKDGVVRALRKAKEHAEMARMYLIANERRDDIVSLSLAIEHIDIVLEHLGKAPINVGAEA